VTAVSPSDAAFQVAQFHMAFDVGSKFEPETAEIRRRLHCEEHQELDEALRLAVRDETSDRADTRKLVARELADVVYVAYGTAELLGIDLDRAFTLVHEANMAKLPPCPSENCRGGVDRRDGLLCSECSGIGRGSPIKDADDKVLRPPGWQPPDMSDTLR
jgi:predicted HAD superfamily Cof-like phosphohydrolase